MITHSSEERLALLLSVLGKDATKQALKDIHPTRAVFIKTLLEEYEATPPSASEVAMVIKDFKTFFSFAMKTLKPEVEKAEAERNSSAATGTSSGKSSAGSGGKKGPEGPSLFNPIEHSGDYAKDLNNLDPYQLNVALADEQPQTIALILGELNTVTCASILKEMEDEVRAQTLLFYSQGSNATEAVVQQVLKSTFERANAVRVRKTTIDRTDVMADLLRSMPKEIRANLIAAITEKDESIIESIREKLYVWDDVLRLGDRDVQKLIGEVQSDDLIVGLQDCDPAISDKILGNLSKRARASIESEMEYKTEVAQSEIELARSNIIKAIGSLDEAGEITME